MVYARRADRRAAGAEHRAVVAEERAGRAERRDEERLDRERRDASDRSLARITVDATGSSGAPGVPGAIYYFAVRNVGNAVAQEVRLWLRDHVDRDVSTMVGGPDVTLVPHDPPTQLDGVKVRTATPRDELFVWIAWTDDAGTHDARTSTRPS